MDWRPKFCRNEAIQCVVELWGGCCVVIQAKFCCYVGRLWVGMCRSVVIGVSDARTDSTIFENNLLSAAMLLTLWSRKIHGPLLKVMSLTRYCLSKEGFISWSQMRCALFGGCRWYREIHSHCFLVTTALKLPQVAE